MKKKLISWLISSVMAVNILALMPINCFAASGDSRIYEKEGYTVTYSVGSEWDNNQTIEVKIENTGEESILNWALRYDIDGTLSNVWNSKVLSSNEEYTVIKNNGYNYEIAPGQSVNYGYILTSETDKPAKLPEDIEMYSRRIEVKSGYDVDFNITSDWYTGFQAEVSITNTSTEPIEAWTLLFDGNFTINNIWDAKLLSSENGKYEVANQLWTTPIKAGESASFGFTANKSATENAKAENFQLTAVVIGESVLEKEPVIDYELDTDEDGLPDYYEEIIGTDKNKADTDGDGLSDGYEILYLGTDPLKADSDDNGVNDGDEDSDNDELTNAKECKLGTDPNNADTDGDGLSDGTEVNTHGTDPLKYDTDGDGISDGDEIALGLNPNSAATDGTPDGERTFTQTVDAESEVLSAINDDESVPFDVSLEMKAAGVAENNVYVRESGYSNAIENSAIIGVAPEFVYTNGLAVEEVTVKFELDDSIIDNTLGTYVSSSTEFEGIKRLNVFMFFEDVNMLLPVETFHDEATNIVYTTTDRMGTYCLVDMELFFDNLDIVPSDSGIEEDYEVENKNVLDEPVFSSYNISERKFNTGATEYKDNFDVAFVVGEVCYDQSQLEGICNEIYAISEIIFNNSKDVTISVYGLDGTGNTQSTWYGRTDNLDGVEQLLSHVEAKEINNIDNMVVVSDCIDYVTLAHMMSDSTEQRSRAEYCFMFFDPTYNNSKGTAAFKYLAKTSRTDEYGIKMLEAINREGTEIDFSTVTSSYQTIEERTLSYTKLLSYETDGINIDDISFENVVSKSIEHIYGKKPTNVYKAIIATGYNTVVLDKPLTEKDKDNAEKLYDNPDYKFSSLELEGCADTDDDGLLDFQEVMFFTKKLFKRRDVIKFKNGEIILPTVRTIVESYTELAYIEKGIEKAHIQYGDCWYDFYNNYPVLPIYSDPTQKDTDLDELEDAEDRTPLRPYLVYSNCLCKNYDDNSITEHFLISALVDEKASYLCVNCGESFLSPDEQDEALLTDQEFALVQAIKRVIEHIESVNLDENNDTVYLTQNHIESLYKIIDDIRVSKSFDGHSSYEYSALIDGYYRYISPINYKVTDASDKNHKINITAWQNTKADIYGDLHAKLIASYGAEAVVSNVAPFWAYPVVNTAISKFSGDSLVDAALNDAITVQDQIMQTIIDPEYKLLERLIAVEKIDKLGKYIPSNLKLSSLKPSDLIGIGNIMIIYNYFKSAKAIDGYVESSNVSEYMFNFAIEIEDENLGTYIYYIQIDYNYRNKVKQYSIKTFFTKETYANSGVSNTYNFDNNTYGKTIIDGKHNIIDR